MLHEQLVSSILNDDIEAGLYETGHLLKGSKTHVLESTWIHIMSVVGEVLTTRDVAEYQRCIMSIVDVIQNDDIHIQNAFLITTRMTILCRKYATLYAKPKLNKLREQIITIFPEGATLNASGVHTFQTILPPADSEESEFVQRILAGLSKLWIEKRYDESRAALEFLSRKKLSISKPKWVAPQIRDDCDIIWVLWGAVLTFFKSEIVHAVYTLFTFTYKKQVKQYRLGLLWCVYSLTTCSYINTDEWTDEEHTLYDRVSNNVENLWKQVTTEGNNEEQDTDILVPLHPNKNISKLDPDFWVSYLPRVKQLPCGSDKSTGSSSYFKEEVRTLKLKESRTRVY